MRAFTTSRGVPKTHYRKGCKICIETQCGCSLPFRKLTQIRRWKALDAKPILYRFRFFRGLTLSQPPSTGRNNYE